MKSLSGHLDESKQPLAAHQGCGAVDTPFSRHSAAAAASFMRLHHHNSPTSAAHHAAYQNHFHHGPYGNSGGLHSHGGHHGHPHHHHLPSHIMQPESAAANSGLIDDNSSLCSSPSPPTSRPPFYHYQVRIRKMGRKNGPFLRI